jgi:hypothetical protein
MAETAEVVMTLCWKRTGAVVKVGDLITRSDTGETVTVEDTFAQQLKAGGAWLSAGRVHGLEWRPTGSAPAGTPSSSSPSFWSAPSAKGNNPAMICPHCQEKGGVSTKAKKLKQGLSGGKVVAALFTGGLSAITPGIGLSRKQAFTEATCGNCGSAWLF